MKKTLALLLILSIALIGCTQPECETNSDCTKCEGNQKARAVCSNGTCEEPWVYECSKSCGAECVKDEDCGQGNYCEAQSCSCKQNTECVENSDCEEGFYCENNTCNPLTTTQMSYCEKEQDCKKISIKTCCCGQRQACINKEYEQFYNQNVIEDCNQADCTTMLCPTYKEIECTCSNNACIEKTKQVKQPEFEFKVKECDDEVNAYLIETSINKTEWNENTLEIKAYVVLNCVETPENGYYEIKNNEITLKYEYMPCNVIGMCADCMCAHEITYLLRNLEKKDYAFSLEAVSSATKCSEDSDCIAIPENCCDCMNGGEETCVNKEHQDKIISRPWCEDAMCLTVVNQDGCANCSCVEGECKDLSD